MLRFTRYSDDHPVWIDEYEVKEVRPYRDLWMTRDIGARIIRRKWWRRSLLVNGRVDEVGKRIAIARGEHEDQHVDPVSVGDIRELHEATKKVRDEVADLYTQTKAQAEITTVAKVIAMDHADQAKESSAASRENADEAIHAKKEAMAHRNDAEQFHNMACAAATSARNDTAKASEFTAEAQGHEHAARDHAEAAGLSAQVCTSQADRARDHADVAHGAVNRLDEFMNEEEM